MGLLSFRKSKGDTSKKQPDLYDRVYEALGKCDPKCTPRLVNEPHRKRVMVTRRDGCIAKPLDDKLNRKLKKHKLRAEPVKEGSCAFYVYAA